MTYYLEILHPKYGKTIDPKYEDNFKTHAPIQKTAAC